MKKISRRGFLKGMAASALGVGVMGASAIAEEKSGIAWDAEYDVVVLGYGGAGANAAVAAYEEGAKVLLTDKAPAGLEGGNTQASGQFIMSTDDPDQLYTYLTTLMDGHMTALEWNRLLHTAVDTLDERQNRIFLEHLLSGR